MSAKNAKSGGPSNRLGLDHLKQAAKLIQAKPVGRYTVREIYGVIWNHMHRPKLFGRLFKASVLHGDLENIRLVSRKSNRSLVYEVLTPVWTPTLPPKSRVGRSSVQHAATR